MIETYLKEAEVNGVKTWRTYTKIENLKPDPQNPRDISEQKAKDLVEFISKYGDLKPVLVDVRPEKEGQLIGGNKRLEAKRTMGATEVWIEPRDPITDAQAFEMGTIDNMEFGHYVEKKLAEALKLYKDDIDLSKLGVSLGTPPSFEEMMKRFNTQGKQDKAPAVDNQNPPASKTGEVYQLGNHRLICGDATDPEVYKKLLGDTKVDLIFTDPPYNVAYEGKTKDALTIQNDKMGKDAFYDFLFAAFKNMVNHSKSGAAIYVCHADTERVNFTKAFQDAGYKLAQVIIWSKSHFVMGRQDYQWQHEPLLYGWKEGTEHYYNGGRSQTTLWNIDRPTASEEHPTIKPIQLITRALNNSSKGDDIILDPFVGSGSTLIACEQAGRICYAIELDPKYVDVIRKRYAKWIGKQDTWQEATPAIGDVSATTQGSPDPAIQPESAETAA